MTIVIAKQYGERIIIQSDTAIANEPSGPNVIPGRLKAIVLSPMASVAFAGAADRADWVIRRSPEFWRKEGLQGLLEWLAQNTQATGEGWDNSVSYVVASHLNGAELYRVWDGRYSRPLPQTWIGDQSAYSAFMRAESQLQCDGEMGSPMGDEHRFNFAFNELFYSSRRSAEFQLRGFSVNLLASPWGHCYQPTAVSFDPDPIVIGHDVSGEAGAWLKSPGLWNCAVYGSRYRGVGVVGALVPQAGVSFIYAPMLDRKAVRFPLCRASPNWHEDEPRMTLKLISELDRVAEMVGGGVSLTSRMWK